MQKLFIKNRRGQKLSVLVEEGPKGAPHSLKEPAHLGEMKDLMDKWIKRWTKKH